MKMNDKLRLFGHGDFQRQTGPTAMGFSARVWRDVTVTLVNGVAEAARAQSWVLVGIHLLRHS